ncbi:unnamed protein product [Sphagnum tenellum]
MTNARSISNIATDHRQHYENGRSTGMKPPMNLPPAYEIIHLPQDLITSPVNNMAYAASANQFINEITPAFYWQNSKPVKQASPSPTRRAWTNLFKRRMPAMGLKSAYTKLASPPSPMNGKRGNFTSDTGLTFNETHPIINSRGLSPLNKKFPYTPAGTHQNQRKY